MPRNISDLFEDLDGTPAEESKDNKDPLADLDGEDDDVDQLEKQRKKPAAEKKKPAKEEKAAKEEDDEEEEEEEPKAEEDDAEDDAPAIDDEEDDEEPAGNADEEEEEDDDLAPADEFDEEVNALKLPKTTRAEIQKLIDARVGASVQEQTKLKETITGFKSKTVELEDAITKVVKENLAFEEEKLLSQRRQAIEDGDTETQIKIDQLLADFNARKYSFNQLVRDQEADRKRKAPPAKKEGAAEGEDQQIKRHVANPLADAWLAKNPWFNKPGFERKSRMLRVLDQELFDEGKSVHDPSYYRELSRRLNEAMGEKPSAAAASKKSPPATVQKKTSPVAAKPGSTPKKTEKVTVDKNDDVFKLFGINPDKRAMKFLAAERRTKR